MKILVSFTFFVLMLAASRCASAEMRKPTIERARELLLDGNRHYKVREFDRAIELYKQGALTESVPVFWYNLGQCFRQKGKYKEAIWYYKRYLAEAEGDDERPQVERFIDSMQKELEGQARNETPLSPAPETTAAPPPPPVAAPPPPPLMPPPPPPAPPRNTMRLVGYGVGGAGVLLVGAGLIVGAGASSSWSDARALCEEGGSPLPCSASAVDLHDDAAAKARTSTILVGTGLAVTAAGAALILLAPRERRIGVVPVVTPSVSGLAIAGGF